MPASSALISRNNDDDAGRIFDGVILRVDCPSLCFWGRILAKRLLPLPALILLSLTAGCERLGRDYFPFHAGNRWEYRTLNAAALEELRHGREVRTNWKLGPADDFESPAAALIAPDDEAGERDEADGQAPAAVVQEPPLEARGVVMEMLEHDPGDDPLTWRVRYNNVEQLWSKREGFLSFQDGRGRTSLLILPPHTGYRWEVVRKTGMRVYFEVEAHADLRTPVGLFEHCVISRQESRDRREIIRYWFAPNVGLVRRSKYWLDQEVFRLELLKCRVKLSKEETIRQTEKATDQAVWGRRKEKNKQAEDN
jgi:hypothetical protein